MARSQGAAATVSPSPSKLADVMAPNKSMILLPSTLESDIPMPSSGTRDDAEFVTDLELAIVVPTFNEIDNIGTLIAVVQTALEGHAYEIIVVDDDSPDGSDRVRQIAKRDRRVRCIQRIGRRGLSGAFIEGALATAAPIVAVIDGDMQHDEMLLPAMLKTLSSSNFDVVIGYRYLGRVLINRVC